MNPTTWGAFGPPVPDLCGCEAPGPDRKDTGTKLASRQKAGSEGGVLALTLSLVSGSSGLGAGSALLGCRVLRPGSIISAGCCPSAQHECCTCESSNPQRAQPQSSPVMGTANILGGDGWYLLVEPEQIYLYEEENLSSGAQEKKYTASFPSSCLSVSLAEGREGDPLIGIPPPE